MVKGVKTIHWLGLFFLAAIFMAVAWVDDPSYHFADPPYAVHEATQIGVYGYDSVNLFQE